MFGEEMHGWPHQCHDASAEQDEAKEIPFTITLDLPSFDLHRLGLIVEVGAVLSTSCMHQTTLGFDCILLRRGCIWKRCELRLEGGAEGRGA